MSMQISRKSNHWFKNYHTYKFITLKMGSRSPKAKHVINLSQIIYPWKSYEYQPTRSSNSSFRENLSLVSWPFTLIMLSMSTNHSELLGLGQNPQESTQLSPRLHPRHLVGEKGHHKIRHHQKTSPATAR